MALFFNNTFPKYSVESSKDLLSSHVVSTTTAIQISPKFKEDIIQTVKNLLTTWKKNVKPVEVKSKDCSVYTGTAGYAVLYLHCYHILGQRKYLQDAEIIVNNSLPGVKGKRVTYLCGDAGPLVTAALVSHALGPDRRTLIKEPKEYVNKLLRLCPVVVAGKDELPDELLYGRVGYLYALLLLHSKQICREDIEPKLSELVQAVLESGKTKSAQEGLELKCPLMYEWHGKRYYGAAHGLAGILTILMQARDHLPTGALTSLVRPCVDYLRSELFPSGNMPSSAGSDNGDRLVHWCHGAPAALILFAMAYKVFSAEAYLDEAKRCAGVVWQRGLLQKGCGLCHGAAGNAYSLLYLYQVSGEAQYLYQACQFARWCQEPQRSPPADRPHSLFEGLAGTLYFLLDLTCVQEAAFPGHILPSLSS